VAHETSRPLDGAGDAALDEGGRVAGARGAALVEQPQVAHLKAAARPRRRPRRQADSRASPRILALRQVQQHHLLLVDSKSRTAQQKSHRPAGAEGAARSVVGARLRLRKGHLELGEHRATC